MTAVIAILVFVLIIGLCVGSFLNVVILRSLSEESIIFPASKCPKCGQKLKWYHNIPILSYIMLRGKCAFCKTQISIQYPIIEFLTGILFTAAFLKFFIGPVPMYGINFGNWLNTVYAWIVISLLIILAGTDIKEKVVFDKHTYTLIAAGLIYSLVITIIAILYSQKTTGHLPLNTEFLIHNPITNALLGLISGAVIMELLARSGYLFAGTRAFGEGDTYIAAGIGAVFGWEKLIAALILSIIIQLIITLPIFFKKLFKNKDYAAILSLSGFFLYAVIFLILQNKGILSNGVVYSICAIILAAIGIYACVRIIKDLKENKDNMTYLPFGPAMAIAALLMIAL